MSASCLGTLESPTLLPSSVPNHPYFLVNPGFLFRRPTAIAILFAWLIVIFWLTQGVLTHPDARVNMIPFRSIARDLYRLDRDFVINFIGNLLGFIPLGFYLPFARTSRTSLGFVIAAGIGVSAFIEFLQYLSGERVCDIDDITLNTTSTVVGYELALFWIARQWKLDANRSMKART